MLALLQKETCTILVTRVRVKYRWLSPLILFNLIIEFLDILMMRKCMLGIKRRAEAMPPSEPLEGLTLTAPDPATIKRNGKILTP